MRTVWITRALPAAEATAGRLRAMGLEPVIAPLLEARPVGDGPIDLAGAGAVAFTSANAVRAFAARSSLRATRVFAVGEATAAAARTAGFADVLSADGDVAALAEAIGLHKNQLGGAVLHAGAAEPAGDLVGALAARGIEARRLALYETVPAALDPEMPTHLPDIDMALVYSPKAGRILAHILARTPAPSLSVLCMSEAVAAPLRGLPLAALSVAASPDEDSLLSLLGR